MNNAWLVRPYPHDNPRLNEFQSKNIVAIGWPNIGDLSGKSREELKTILSGTPYYLNGLALGNAYATVDILVNSMQVGDFVLVADGADIYFGEITSDYIFDPAVDNDNYGYPHQRSIKWLSNTSRKELSMPLRSSLKVHRTTANLTKHFEEIKALSHGEEFISESATSTTLNVTYPLRADFSISFDIPNDISKSEAKRLSQYIESLYFNE
jgi:predicted Mrr-cat superfamily restriction endonuclease